MAETAVLPDPASTEPSFSPEPTPIPGASQDMGMFASLAPYKADPTASESAYPDMGVFDGLPAYSPTPSPTPDMGMFANLPAATPMPGDESQKALDEAPMILRSPAQVDYLDAKMVREQGPAVEIPKATIEPADPTLEKAGKAAYNTVAGFAEGLTSADGINGILNPLLGVSELASSIPEIVNQVRKADSTPPNSPERWQAASTVIGFLALPAVAHYFNKAPFKPKIGEPNAIPKQSTGSLGAYAGGDKGLGRAGESSGVGLIEQGSKPTGATASQGETQVPPAASETVPIAPDHLAPVATEMGLRYDGSMNPPRGKEIHHFTDNTPGNQASISVPNETTAEEFRAKIEAMRSARTVNPVQNPAVTEWTGATAEPIRAPETPAPTSLESRLPVNETELMSGLPLPKFEMRKMTPLDSATGQRSAVLQNSSQKTLKTRNDLRKMVPSKAKREAISIYLEANGDTGVLANWEAQAKSSWMKKAARDAQKLTLEEIVAARDVRAAFDTMAKRGMNNGVLKSQRDNYVTHVWKLENPNAGFGIRSLKKRFKFAKARTLNNFFEGDQAGMKLRTLDIADLLPGYISEMDRVIADRQFVDSLVGLKGKDGNPLVIPRGRISTIVDPEGNPTFLARPDAQNLAFDAKGDPIDQSKYRVIQDQPALRSWRWRAKDAEGNPIFMEGDLALSPEAYRRIKAMMGQSRIRNWYRDVEGSMQIPKAIARGLDISQSALKREMFGLLPPFHQVQVGTHGIGHLVNPFFGLKEFDATSPKVQDAMTHGLMLLSDKTSSFQYFEGVGAHDTMLSRLIRKGGKAGRAVADVVDGYQQYVFGSYIPRLKYATYEKILARNMERFKDEMAKGEVSESDVKLLSGQQTNAAYGHLNYALLDRDPTFQHFLQLGLLAPDFLEARGRFVAQAGKAISSKQGSEQLKAIAILATVQAATAYTMSQLTGGEWDGSHPFEFTLDNRRYTMRSVPEDLMRLATDTRAFISARVNPTLQTIDQMRTGINYRGEKVSFLDTVEEFLAKYIPMTARSLPGLRDLTETSKNSPLTPMEQYAGSAGLKISRYSPISETYKLADQWMKDQGKPSDTGAYPISKYQQLRYALEDGDLEKAGTEYDKLVADTTPEKLRQGFNESILHPFTGTRKSDVDFADSLSPKDRSIYDLAVEKRKDMQQKFTYLARSR